VQLTLTKEHAFALWALLDGSLREMSHEIAATDNAAFRARLVERRRQLAEVADSLDELLTVQPTPETGGSDAVIRELARPGGG
jgi:hypothetical protein